MTLPTRGYAAAGNRARPRAGSESRSKVRMSRTDRDTSFITDRRSAAIAVSFLLLSATVFLLPVPARADVGDQYLPVIPDAGGKQDQTQTQIQPVPAPEYSSTGGEKDAKGEKPSEDSTEKAQISPLPPDQGGGPGTGAVVALIVLGAALVGSLFWVVSRSRGISSESGAPSDGPPHRPDTPPGEITGDGPTEKR